VGIVGHGRIGRTTARKIAAFGCRVVVHSRSADPRADVEFVSLPELLGMADVVILHVPLTPGTRQLIGAPELAAMRDGALLVNVSRGGLVDTAALIGALDAGRVGGAALDVLEAEPAVDPALLAHPNVVITPHVAFSSDESVEELRTKAAEEVVRVLSGQAPHYPCNTPALPSNAEEHAR
jgi:D-3-phosphoglycerate dehydrogenase